jgi:hypothetical protein
MRGKLRQLIEAGSKKFSNIIAVGDEVVIT